MNSASCGVLYWDFSLDVYSADSVAPSCLTLQDDIGLDVNVLLLSLLASHLKRRIITPDEIAMADRLVRQWRESIVVGLRHIRRTLKTGPAPAPSVETDKLRQLVTKAELDAERIEQAMLAQWLDTLPATPCDTDDYADHRQSTLCQVGRHVVDYYAKGTYGARALNKDKLYHLSDVVAKAASRSNTIRVIT